MIMIDVDGILRRSPRKSNPKSTIDGRSQRCCNSRHSDPIDSQLFLQNNRNYEYLVYGITNTRATAQFLIEILRLYCTRDHSSIYCFWFVGLCTTTCQSQNRQVSNIVNVFGLPDANGTGYRESVSANHYYLLLLKIYFLKMLVPPVQFGSLGQARGLAAFVTQKRQNSKFNLVS